MRRIKQIFFLPPMAVGRLGASDNPLDNFVWAEDPSVFGAGRTVVLPSVTLQVLRDGSVRPFLPSVVQFRDDAGFRPAAPFFELWAKVVGEPEPIALTTSLLAENQCALSSLTFSVLAANRKAARRTNDPSNAYSASLRVVGDDHQKHSLLASSEGPNPLVLPNKPIPLGSFQVLLPEPATADRLTTEAGVDLSVVRVRFTPARGEVYGPPDIDSVADPDDQNRHSGRLQEVVPPKNRILSANSTWQGYNADDIRFMNPEPDDTYDGADAPRTGDSCLGVVDDTCDVVINAELTVAGRALQASARVFVSPPDFAPDRRPFASMAEELTDRDPPPQQTPESQDEALARLGDLFQRVFETASLANVDAMRDRALVADNRGNRHGVRDGLPATNGDSMTRADQPFFDRTTDLTSPPSTHERLPYASVAQDVHASLADIEDLALFLRTSPERVRQLIRPPYGAFKDLAADPAQDRRPDPVARDPRITRDTVHDMRMPPYMRDSDATPLSLNRFQFNFLMEVLNRLQPPTRGRRATAIESPVQRHVKTVARRRTNR